MFICLDTFLNIRTNMLDNSSRGMLAITESGLISKNPDSIEDCLSDIKKKPLIFLARRGKLIKENKSAISRKRKRKERR